MFNSIAYAADKTATAQGANAIFGSLVPFIMIIAIMYFLVIRPQQKKAKEHRAMIDNLKKGDQVITTGGIYGKIVAIDDTTATIEIADKVRIKVLRSNVAALESSISKS